MLYPLELVPAIKIKSTYTKIFFSLGVIFIYTNKTKLKTLEYLPFNMDVLSLVFAKSMIVNFRQLCYHGSARTKYNLGFGILSPQSLKINQIDFTFYRVIGFDKLSAVCRIRYQILQIESVGLLNLGGNFDLDYTCGRKGETFREYQKANRTQLNFS